MVGGNNELFWKKFNCWDDLLRSSIFTSLPIKGERFTLLEYAYAYQNLEVLVRSILVHVLLVRYAHVWKKKTLTHQLELHQISMNRNLRWKIPQNFQKLYNPRSNIFFSTRGSNPIMLIFLSAFIASKYTTIQYISNFGILVFQ